ncbi:MAG: hypothetical protein ACOY4R_21870 [Pseudomonadota bacterium]
MSHSVPSDSSTIDSTFLVGTDLVQFDRHDLPIYATPQALWDTAFIDDAPVGMPLDRLFGEPGGLHVDGTTALPQGDPVALVPVSPEDPLVAFATLSDGVAFATDLAPAHDAPGEIAANSHPFDGGLRDGGLHGAAWHDGGWDAAGLDAMFDFLT